MDLFKVLTVSEAKASITKNSETKRAETVALLDSLGRVLAVNVTVLEDVPGFHRSTMDGYAVKAKDTFGASESLPAYLDIGGEILMGKEAVGELKLGQAWPIPTGGMLPPGADAVVMIEYTEELDHLTIGVTRPVAPGENVVRRGEDVQSGAVVLNAGHRVRPQDLGLLSAVGVTEVMVLPQVKVAIVSTGDEVISPEMTPQPGQVRDINSYALYGQVKQSGGKAKIYGIVKDDFESLKSVLTTALAENDIVLVSGGSSVGTRDVTSRVIDTLGKPGVLFHGISIKPGKPTIGAMVDGKVLFGLPGHPVSAMVVYSLLVDPLVRWGDYHKAEEEPVIRARLTRNMRSAAGREDFLRVRLYIDQGELMAEPVLGKSGLISTMVKAHGLARIPEGKEGVEAGEYLEVKLF